MLKFSCVVSLLSLASMAAIAAEGTAAPAQGAAKSLSGMSVLGNNEAPKSLVIVPWKSSELGDGIGIANLLDERAVPVDREVFSRELSYYELRKGSIPKGNTAHGND